MAIRTYVVFWGLPEANLMTEVTAPSPAAAASAVARSRRLLADTMLRVSAWNKDGRSTPLHEFVVVDSAGKVRRVKKEGDK